MLCRECHAENPTAQATCVRCGTALPRRCNQCGLEVPPGFRFCGYCGASLSGADPAPARPVIATGGKTVPARRSSLEGERRFVVVLFADIAGFTRLSEELDAEEATTLVNYCLEAMTRAVVQHGGRLDKYTGDGLLAVFGAPLAHEDDPERALRATLAMQQAVDELKHELGLPQLALHFGLACGRVVAAALGGRGRREYTVIGTAVNLAARLEGASGLDQILVSEELARLASHAFAFRPVTLPGLQGWEGPVQAYELLHRRRARRPGRQPARRSSALQSPLVGRDAEIARLRQALASLAEGQGGILALIGEAGTGKSRLVHEVRVGEGEREGAQQGGAPTWLVGSALSDDHPARYACFRHPLAQAMADYPGSRPEAAGPAAEQLRAHLEDVLPGRVEAVYPHLAQVLGLPLPAEVRSRWEWLDGEELRRQFAVALQEWLSALADRGPLVLWLEDLQWLDAASAGSLIQILPLSGRQPLLLVASFRPEQDRPVWHLREILSAFHAAVYAELRLPLLAPAAMRHMVCHLLGSEHVPDEALAFVARRAEGNPWFVEEIVSYLVDHGLLVRLEQDGGRWEMAPGWADLAVPNTIQGLFQARVDRLEPEAKRILQIAACAGRRFPYRLLLDVAAGEAGAHDLEAQIEALEAASLLRLEEASPGVGRRASDDQVCRFRHVLIRDTVYGSLLKGTRRRLHAAIARWYEAHTLDDPEPPYALLAHHYEQASEATAGADAVRQRRLFYYTQAGDQAMRAYANAEARSFYGRALELAADPAGRSELLAAREQVCQHLGDRVQQKADLEELLALAGQLKDAGLATLWRSRAYNRLAEWHASQGDYGAVRAMAHEALAAAPPEPEGARLEAESRNWIANAAWRLGEFGSAREAGQAALGAAQRAGDPALEAACLTTLGVIHRSLEDAPAASTCYRQALALRRRLDDRWGEAINLAQLGNVSADAGEYGEALEYHRQALDLFCLVGDRQGEAWSLHGLGIVCTYCGAWDQAQAHNEQALAIRRAIGDRRGEAITLASLANVLSARGDQAAARGHLEQALALLRELGARRDEVYALTYLGQVLEKAGEVEAAAEAHEAALALRQVLGQGVGLDNLAGLARLALARGDGAGALAFCHRILAQIGEEDGLLAGSERPFVVYYTCARVLEAAGEDARAEALLLEAGALLRGRAARIGDPALRCSFLEQVPEHRAILAAAGPGQDVDA